MVTDHFDVIVVGAGHAGCEAASAASRAGAKTLLLTHSLDTVGQMSCNPAIGGIGKSHLVKEVSAMGGVMPVAADAAAIHKRVLNESKGAAVRATRAQSDRTLYRQAVRHVLDQQENLHFFQQPVSDLVIEGDVVTGVKTEMGLVFSASAVVLTTGTFLSGKIHIGRSKHSGGRAGDQASHQLASYLREHGRFRFGRLKTGTPPRIDRKTIDFTHLEVQPSCPETPAFDFWAEGVSPKQMDCYLTYTNEKTHAIIREYMGESAIFSGDISGTGPRYCPSIEDKVHRFASQNRHQIFIEPEGLQVDEIYPSGISTSLPFVAQKAMINSIAGFENAHITRPGYAIEYDYFDPRDLLPHLESRYISRLFFAGQINGTTGYEEAAAQGLLAGLNAALLVKGQSPWVPSRAESYMGVLVDDLVKLGTKEPYRMFTSRAEHRLLLREDNADTRLTEQALSFGMLTEKQAQIWANKKASIANYQKLIQQKTVHPGTKEAHYLKETVNVELTQPTKVQALVKRPEVEALHVSSLLGDPAPHLQALGQLVTDLKYEGYIARQKEEVLKQKKHEETVIPETFDYDLVQGLSNEVIEKLKAARPHTVGSASRISGVTPAAISILMVYLKRATKLVS